MGIFDQLKGATEGPDGGLMSHVMSVLQDPRHGGIGGLVQAFHRQGLSGLLSSWIGTGPNAAISPAQLESVLGSERLRAIEAKAGLTPQEITAKLATLLPGFIDRLSPTGTLPDGTSAEQVAQGGGPG